MRNILLRFRQCLNYSKNVIIMMRIFLLDCLTYCLGIKWTKPFLSVPGLLSPPRHKHHVNKAHGANMGPIWGRQDPGGSHVGPMNFAIWATMPITMRDRWIIVFQVVTFQPLVPSQYWVIFISMLMCLYMCLYKTPASWGLTSRVYLSCKTYANTTSDAFWIQPVNGWAHMVPWRHDNFKLSCWMSGQSNVRIH